ncbi:MAG TPA: RNA polymerase subunit sigma [Ureibacillus sp.]|nr:RNA polymerase subunit sigma [Ureibacillus sp.]
MSLKGVELQIAIPKTFDAGKIAEHHQHNVLQNQMNANEALKKELERKQLTVNDTEPTEKINKDGNNNSGNNQETSDEEKKKKESKEATHPFKGHLFDYSG